MRRLGPWLRETGQAPKYWALITTLLLAGLYLRLTLRAASIWTVLAMAVQATCFVAICLSIRCPRCQTRVF
jgi:hypothetical protein